MSDEDKKLLLKDLEKRIQHFTSLHLSGTKVETTIALSTATLAYLALEKDLK